MLPQITSWRSILILSSHLQLGIPSDLLPSGFTTKTLYTPLPSPTHASFQYTYNYRNNHRFFYILAMACHSQYFYSTWFLWSTTYMFWRGRTGVLMTLGATTGVLPLCRWCYFSYCVIHNVATVNRHLQTKQRLFPCIQTHRCWGKSDCCVLNSDAIFYDIHIHGLNVKIKDHTNKLIVL
jgi:hypothetical protein